MLKIDISEYQKQKPVIQLAPLVDIAFWALIFFMIIAIVSQVEDEVGVNLPKSSAAAESTASAGKIVINITRDGQFIVNQQRLDGPGLEEMLKKIVGLFPNQQVIIRADELAYHKYVVQVLDACVSANIHDVGFSTIKEEKR